MYSPSSPRYRHRKRLSSLRLSTESVAPLPAYTAPLHLQHEPSQPSDDPPDYPDSSDDGDADTEDFDSDSHKLPLPSLPLSPPLSPRRRSPIARRAHLPKRLTSTSTSDVDPYLDSLLARSVHALEMSNTLLQSSMSTTSRLSTILTADSPVDRELETRARLLSSRIHGTDREEWMDDLEAITKSVDSLLGEESGAKVAESSVAAGGGALSSSLPTKGSIRKVRQRPSLDLRKAPASQAGTLHFSNHNRNHLIAPPPRALTLYVDSTDDPDSIMLPSTLGLRASTSSHLSELSSISAEIAPAPSITQTHSRSNSQPQPKTRSRTSSLVGTPSESSTPAYTLLSSFVTRPAPSSRSSSLSKDRPRRASASTSTSPSRDRDCLNPKRKGSTPSRSRSRSVTPIMRTTSHSRSPPLMTRPMTPPIEELSSGSTSSTDPSPNVTRTLESLRKILSDQPQPQPQPSPEEEKKSATARPRPPSFLPRTAPPEPAAGTSNATASVSRLWTKGRHHTSTRPPSPPTRSSMKGRSAPPTPVESTFPFPGSASLLSVPPPLISVTRSMGEGSVTSSGVSTPKRTSFAELPESYASSKPGGRSSKFKEKETKRGRKKTRSSSSSSSSSADSGWWTGWLLGAAGTSAGAGLSLAVERSQAEEDRRGWGGRARFGGSMDDWAV